MENVCDICGFQNHPKARYCGKCGVDLTEEPTPAESERHKPTNHVFKWCEVYSVLTTDNRPFIAFFNLLVNISTGNCDIEFCGCPVCRSAYYEIETVRINAKENKTLKPSSREIVSKFYKEDIAGMRLDLPGFIKYKIQKK